MNIFESTASTVKKDNNAFILRFMFKHIIRLLQDVLQFTGCLFTVASRQFCKGNSAKGIF